MPRPYSDKFLIGLQSADDERVGIQLAKVCVEAKLPALYIADYFSVTRMTVHWVGLEDIIYQKKTVLKNSTIY